MQGPEQRESGNPPQLVILEDLFVRRPDLWESAVEFSNRLSGRDYIKGMFDYLVQYASMPVQRQSIIDHLSREGLTSSDPIFRNNLSQLNAELRTYNQLHTNRKDKLCVYSIDKQKSLLLDHEWEPGTRLLPAEKPKYISSLIDHCLDDPDDLRNFASLCHSVEVVSDTVLQPVLSRELLQLIDVLLVNYPNVASFDIISEEIWNYPFDELTKYALWTLKGRLAERIMKLSGGDFDVKFERGYGYKLVHGEEA